MCHRQCSVNIEWWRCRSRENDGIHYMTGGFRPWLRTDETGVVSINTKDDIRTRKYQIVGTLDASIRGRVDPEDCDCDGLGDIPRRSCGEKDGFAELTIVHSVSRILPNGCHQPSKNYFPSVGLMKHLHLHSTWRYYFFTANLGYSGGLASERGT